MRRVFNPMVRGLAAVLVIVAFSGSALAVTREGREGRDRKDNPVVKVIKKIVKSLGDGLIIPLP